MDRDEEAARLLDEMADQVRIAPAPVERLVGAGRRQRASALLTGPVVVLLALLVLLTASGALSR